MFIDIKWIYIQSIDERDIQRPINTCPYGLSYGDGFIYRRMVSYGLQFFQSDNCEVQDSTLFILAQALTYTGAVIGITEYVRGEFKNFRKEMRNSTEPPTEEE